MSNIIATDVQVLEQDTIVSLFEIDARDLGDGVLRFTTTSNDGAPLSFNGAEYQPLPIRAEGFSWNGTGALPRPTLTLVATDLVFLSLIISSDDLVGCSVRRIRTYRKYLDDGASPNPEAVFPIDHYVIERKASQKRNLLQFELSAEMDQQGLLLPGRQVLRDSCTHSFRRWAGDKWVYEGATCPYAGAAMYTRGGVPTTDPTQAKCGRRLSDCKLHFGQSAVLPFYGFPGVGRY